MPIFLAIIGILVLIVFFGLIFRKTSRRSMRLFKSPGSDAR